MGMSKQLEPSLVSCASQRITPETAMKLTKNQESYLNDLRCDGPLTIGSHTPALKRMLRRVKPHESHEPEPGVSI
jgi:hypothetical protein